MRTLQSSRFSNSMPSPTTHVASYQSSQLEHLSFFSNPALMDDSNPPSLHLNTNSLPTPTRGRRRRREPSPSPPLSPTFSTLHQRPHTHTNASHFLFTLTISPPLDPPYFCAIMNSLSIVSYAQKKTKKSRTPLTISAAPTTTYQFSVYRNQSTIAPLKSISKSHRIQIYAKWWHSAKIS